MQYIRENLNYHIDTVPIRVLPDGRMTREDAAAYLGLKPKTLAMWAMEGKGPHICRVGGRCFYFKDELDAFISLGNRDCANNSGLGAV